MAELASLGQGFETGGEECLFLPANVITESWSFALLRVRRFFQRTLH